MTKEDLSGILAQWSPEKIQKFQTDFLNWYEKERRDLPWRENQDPYRIWVSEIMLQQTQVVTVIPYFYRFMEWFETIADLAEAPEDKLLKAWEGLGYYSRVRNMQVAAQQMMTDFDGQMPQTVEEISSLKGIGPYTAGAIASIAFDLPEPAIDGNVMRVFSRLFELEADIAKPSSRKVFDYVVRQVMPHHDPSSFNQGIMDLGSGICTPNSPNCYECPLQEYCQSFAKGTMLNYPVKSKKVKSRPVYYLAQVIKNSKNEYLLTQRSSEGLLANMWTFPLVEISKEEYQNLKTDWQSFVAADNQQQSLEQLTLDNVAEPFSEYEASYLKQQTGRYAKVVWQKQPLAEVTHIFSHLKWHILVIPGFLNEDTEFVKESRETFAAPKTFNKYPFPKPQQKIVTTLENSGYLIAEE
ncbi:A/G-specific adenine glycosylase [Vagococcus intermedius]|uniref:Adenine DNA glycosylase n=1 Tax=Vagococcus intermedius TaxID=2991418 RepID=A0AAF0CVM3_9ENTE|nr:A/G-specific adenine glycosylase [Vagococcus intermedius]WEG73809.1 A/G-specific adenine glycosylase [Vagococcus intermedius]WEG75894.1 A/G-specific adenine glycosylase [Vagococcus intermedius]